MGFIVQLKLLLWKNFITRKRQKLRCCVELLWPLTLFILLMLVRSKGLFTMVHHCHFEDKPLPSAGQLLFWQGIICAFNNTCHQTQYKAERNYSDIRSSDLYLLVNDVQAFTELAVARNQKSVNNFFENVQTIAENLNVTSIEQDPLNKDPVRNRASPIMHTKSFRRKLSDENYTDSQMNKLLDLHKKLEQSMVELEPTIDVIDSLERINLNYENISDILRKAPIIDEIFIRLHDFMCGNKSKITLSTLLNSKTPMRNLGHLMGDFSYSSSSMEYQYDPESSKECNAVYKKIESTPALKFAWKFAKPYARGKIVFAPNTTVVRRVMKRIKQYLATPQVASLYREKRILDVNQTSYEELMQKLKFIAEEYQNRKDDHQFSQILQLFMHPTILKAQKLLFKYNKKLNDIGKKYSTNKTGNTLAQALKCYSSVTFESYKTEGEAEERSMSLTEKNDLLAEIIFYNSHENHLDPLVNYKIRMNPDRLPHHSQIGTFILANGPNYRPFHDLKLVTYGFVYLQDMIEKSIITEHTNRTDTPGIILRQFPHPCFTEDLFMSSLGGVFPLFMVLSWVYTSSMIIKSIVYEKEQKLREIMKVLGLNNGIHWCSWFIDSIIPMVATVFLLSTILIYGGILAHAEYSLVALFLICYTVATISMCFLISVFFSKANLAASSGGIIFFITYLPYPLIETWFPYVTPQVKFVGCMLSNVALGLGSRYFALRELEGTGSRWSNVASSPIIGDKFNVMVIMIILLIDAVLYFVLAWYIENVHPGLYGIPKAWNYPFTRNYWFPNSSLEMLPAEKEVEQGDSSTMEAEPTHLEKGIAISNLCKVYKNGKVALDNLTLNVYQDQVTAFLGRNGAGKTTTISILTGLFSPTSGKAEVYGLDVRTQMSCIRKNLGICPQYNVLFGDFTVQEHLWFFARLKGHSAGGVQVEIQQILSDLGLLHKRFSPAKHLSGGMKRKLSIAIAFIGGSRTVVLDEPTAGVDPFSRMGIWNIILKYKKGRTIVLTTHNMAEADLLGDRIAICDSGKLICCGSSSFLKSKFGWGYVLTVDCSKGAAFTPEEETHMALTDGIQKIMPEAELVEKFGTELKYSLPRISGCIEQYQSLFEFLQDNKESLGVSSFGIADTTLEEIFLRLVQDEQTEESQKKGEVATNDELPQKSYSEEISFKKQGSPAHLFKQFGALTVKRLLRCKRTKLELVLQMTLPALLICLCMTITSRKVTLASQPAPYPIDISNCSGCISFFNVLPNASKWTTKYLEELKSSTGFGTKCIKKPHDLRGSACEGLNTTQTSKLVLEYDVDKCSCETGNYVCQYRGNVTIPEKIEVSPGHLFYNTTGKNVSNWIVKTWEVYEPLRTGGYTFGVKLPMKGRWLLTHKNVSEFKSDSPTNTDITDNVMIWFNNKWPISPLVYLNGLNNIILRASLPSNVSQFYGIRLVLHGMNLTMKQFQTEVLRKATSALILSISLIFSLSFIPASFVLYLIEERISGSKYLQFLSGVNWAAYWLQAFAWDFVYHSLSTLCCVLVLVAFREEAYTGPQSFQCLILLIVLYGWANIPLMYPASFLFQVPSSAFVALSCLNISIGVITTASTYVLKLFDDEYLRTVELTLRDAFIIFPHFCLGDGLMKIAETYFLVTSLAGYDVKITVNLYSWDHLGKNFTFLFIEGIIFFCIVMLYEKFHRQGVCGEQLLSMDPPEEMDEDVEAEKKRVLNSIVDDVLVLKCLTKIYKSNRQIAVNQICLGVSKGQCFGLLGLNGAGKTSTFKMLTGDTSITFGDASVMGHSVREHINSVRTLIGYCPQFDALDWKLTPREHLMLYARLRNVPQKYFEDVIERCLNNFDLIRYKDVCAKYLSGGNRRKLSTAIALLGNPHLIFLDEPTCGMDPKVRRFMWFKIKQCVLEGRAVILTSHSMSECEALCSRLTIMVNGQFMCLGSIQHLKNKFAQGYNLIVRAPKEKMSDLRDTMTREVPEREEKSAHHNQIKYHLNIKIADLSRILTVLENMRERKLIHDYSLSQKSLVEVFLHFVSNPKQLEMPYRSCFQNIFRIRKNTVDHRKDESEEKFE